MCVITENISSRSVFQHKVLLDKVLEGVVEVGQEPSNYRYIVLFEEVLIERIEEITYSHPWFQILGTKEDSRNYLMKYQVYILFICDI